MFPGWLVSLTKYLPPSNSMCPQHLMTDLSAVPLAVIISHPLRPHTTLLCVLAWAPCHVCFLQRLLQHKVAQHHLLQTMTAMQAGTPRVAAKRPDKSSSSSSSEAQVSSHLRFLRLPTEKAVADKN